MDLLALAVITGTHGTDGAVNVKSLSGEVEHLRRLSHVCLRIDGKELPMRVAEARPTAKGAILRFEGIDSMAEARKLFGAELWASREFASSLGEGEYYVADLCRCTVYRGDVAVGTVISVWEGPSAAMLEVLPVSGKPVMVPFVEAFVGEVNVAAGTIALNRDLEVE